MALLSSPWLKQPFQIGYNQPKKPTPVTQPIRSRPITKPTVTSAPYLRTPAKPAAKPVQKPITTTARQPARGALSTGASLFGGNRPTGLLSERPSANRPAQQRTPARPVATKPTPARPVATKPTPAPFVKPTSPTPWVKQPTATAPKSTSMFSYGNPRNTGLLSASKPTTYTDPRAPYMTFPNKAAADRHFAALQAQEKAEQDRLKKIADEKAKFKADQERDDYFKLFDFNIKDGSDSLWEQDRGLWNNLGNLGVNALGGALGGIGGFMLGGTAGDGGGAGLGWTGANQGYDFIEDKITGDYERNALIDYGTALATGAGLAGGAAYNNFIGSGSSAPSNASSTRSGGGSGRGGYNPVSGSSGSSGSSNNSGGNGFFGNVFDFFTQNPIGQGVTATGATYLADQLFNDGEGTNAVMDFLTGNNSSSSSGGGNEIAYGTDLTPQYIVDAQKEALERARTLTNSYKDYEGPLTAGAAQNELQAANVAADAVGGTADALNDARDMTTGADARYERREGPSSYGSGDEFFDQASLSGYMNPYLEFVQQDTLDNISRENEAIQAALGDQMIQVGAFGGSRTGVAEAENNRNMRQQMLQYINQSNAEAFENARDQFNRDEDRRFAYSEADRNQFNTDLARRLNVGQALGSLASMDSALTQQEINNLMSTGGVLRDIEQAGYTNDFNAYQDFWNRMLGLNAAENAVALGLKSDVLKPREPEEDPDRLGQVLGVLAAGAGLWNTLAGGGNG